MRYIEAYTPEPPAEYIYAIDMKNNASPFEGLPCGVRYLGNDFKTVITGFPLYYMNRDQARAMAQRVMADFGETGVAGKPEDRIQKTEFRMEQSRPNPFQCTTAISYQLSAAGPVKLSIYNIAGQLVKTLVEGSVPPGAYSAKWDGHDASGRAVSGGVYIYRLQAGNASLTGKLVKLQ